MSAPVKPWQRATAPGDSQNIGNLAFFGFIKFDRWKVTQLECVTPASRSMPLQSYEFNMPLALIWSMWKMSSGRIAATFHRFTLGVRGGGPSSMLVSTPLGATSRVLFVAGRSAERVFLLMEGYTSVSKIMGLLSAPYFPFCLSCHKPGPKFSSQLPWFSFT